MSGRESLMQFLRRIGRKPVSTDVKGSGQAGGAASAYSGQSIPAGPSGDYLALLRGEIDAQEYVRRFKADVHQRLRRG